MRSALLGTSLLAISLAVVAAGASAQTTGPAGSGEVGQDNPIQLKRPPKASKGPGASTDEPAASKATPEGMQRALPRTMRSGGLGAPRTGPALKGSVEQDTRLQHISRKAFRTWVKTGLFNEVDQSESSEVGISEPIVMKFRWGTNAPGAEEGFWRLRGKSFSDDPGPGVHTGLQAAPGGGPSAMSAQSGSPVLHEIGSVVLATGVATDAPGGSFTIDLANHLPPAPPAEPLVYTVEVIARTKGGRDASGIMTPGGAGRKLAAQEIGVWSMPVVITYGVASEPTRFAIGDVYRQATVVVDRIILVTDQFGPGREEYHVAGFVQMVQEQCVDPARQDCSFSAPVTQYPIGHLRRTLNPPTNSVLGASRDFTLGTAGNPLSGPRRFLLALSVLEEDDGTSVDDWYAGVQALADAIESDGILDMSPSQLEEFLSDHYDDAIQFVADALEKLGEAVADAASVAGVVAPLAGGAISNAIADMADDYYGTQVGRLTLPSNRVAAIETLPGQIVGSGAGRRFVTSKKRLRFQGPPPADAAAAFDGTVEIEFHWEFGEPQQE